MKANYKIAMAAGRDAGNKHMQAGGRLQWDESDWACACETFRSLYESGT